MKRHRFDPLSFIFGSAFVVLAVALSIKGFDVTADWLRWTAAGVLLLLGVVMLVGSRSRSTDRF